MVTHRSDARPTAPGRRGRFGVDTVTTGGSPYARSASLVRVVLRPSIERVVSSGGSRQRPMTVQVRWRRCRNCSAEMSSATCLPALTAVVVAVVVVLVAVAT